MKRKIKRKNSNVIWFFSPLLIIFFLMMIKFCTPKINEEYTVGKIQRGDLELFIDFKGEVEAKDVIPIGLDIDLNVENIYFKEGDQVKKGDIILKFSDYKEKKIEKEQDDYKSILAEKNSQLRYLEQQNALNGEKKFEIQKLKTEISMIQNQLNLKMKEKTLVIRNVISPIDGYIVKINAIANGSNDSTKPVVILAKLKDIKIISEPILDNNLTQIKIGNKAKVKSINNPDNNFDATLYNIKNTGVSNYKVLELYGANIENRYLKEILDIRLIYNERKESLLVPITAVMKKTKQKTIKLSEEKDKYQKQEQIDIENINNSIKDNGNEEDIKYYIYIIDKNNKVMEKEVELGINNDEIDRVNTHHTREGYLTNYIGYENMIAPYINDIEYQYGDVYISCTDGLDKYISLTNLKEIILENVAKTNEEILELIINKLKKQNKKNQDNVSIIIFK